MRSTRIYIYIIYRYIHVYVLDDSQFLSIYHVGLILSLAWWHLPCPKKCGNLHNNHFHGDVQTKPWGVNPSLPQVCLDRVKNSMFDMVRLSCSVLHNARNAYHCQNMTEIHGKRFSMNLFLPRLAGLKIMSIISRNSTGSVHLGA